MGEVLLYSARLRRGAQRWGGGHLEGKAEGLDRLGSILPNKKYFTFPFVCVPGRCEWDQLVVLEAPGLHCRSPDSGEIWYKSRTSKRDLVPL